MRAMIAQGSESSIGDGDGDGDVSENDDQGEDGNGSEKEEEEEEEEDVRQTSSTRPFSSSSIVPFQSLHATQSEAEPIGSTTQRDLSTSPTVGPSEVETGDGVSIPSPLATTEKPIAGVSMVVDSVARGDTEEVDGRTNRIREEST